MTNSPLSAPSPDSLTALFEADPLTLSDTDLDTLIGELRRRRSAFLAEEAAKALKPKRERASAQAQPASAAPSLDKPTGEISLDDLL